MPRHAALAASLLAALILSTAAAAQVYLVKDIASTPGGPYNSTPSTGFAPLPDGRVLFATRQGLFATDGDPAHITPVSSAVTALGASVPLPGRTAFVNTSGPAPYPVWITDGTPAGTRALLDNQGVPVLAASATALKAHNGKAWAAVSGTNVRVWASDGTQAGTFRTDAPAGVVGATPFDFTLFDDAAWFYDRGPAGTASATIWRTPAVNGTAAAAVYTLPNTLFTGASTPLTPTPTALYFSFTDPVAGGTIAFMSRGTSRGAAGYLNGSSYGFTPLGVLSSGTVIATYPRGTLTELWSVVPPAAPIATSAAGFGPATIIGDSMLMAPVPAAPGVAWRTDGTPAGTYPLTLPGPTSSTGFVPLGAEAWFISADNAGLAWWSTDGTQAGTRSRARLPIGAAVPTTPLAFAHAGRIYFNLELPTIGTEIWTVTPDGRVQLLQDPSLATPSSITSPAFKSSRGRAYFNVWGVPHATDGTAPGTVKLRRLLESREHPPGTIIDLRAADRVVEGASSTLISTPDGLFAYDGVPGHLAVWLGPQMSASSAAASAAATAGAHTYYLASGKLWRTDGTPAGTGPVFASPDAAPYLRAQEPLVALGSSVLFVAQTSTPSYQLWISDGTPSGTRPVSTAAPSASPSSIASAGSFAVFLSGSSVYRTDGTPAGTFPINTQVCGSSLLAARAGPRLFYALSGCFSPENLRVTDGTPGGTTAVPNTNVAALTAVGSRAVFANSTGVFATDGSTAAIRLTTAVPLALSSAPSTVFLAGPDGSAYFLTPAGLWRTDGTPRGTYLARTLTPVGGGPVPTINTATFSLAAPWAAFAGAKLVFDGFTEATGAEPWAFDVCDANWLPTDALDLLDLFAFIEDWFAGRADFDRSGATDLPDLFAYVSAWLVGC